VKQQLSALDTFNTQQQAVMTLMNLQLTGFSEKSIEFSLQRMTSVLSEG
jgi:hypothetical protein